MWKRKCRKKLVQRKNTGLPNLFNYIKNQHKNYNKVIGKNQPLDDFVNVVKSSRKADTIYSWLDWICCGFKPFNFVEDCFTRFYSNLDRYVRIL